MSPLKLSTRSLAMTLLLGACAHPPQRPMAQSTPRHAAPVPASPPAPTAGTRCAELTARAEALLDAALRMRPSCDARTRERLVASFARCEVAAGGAWAALASSVDPPPADGAHDECNVSGTWGVAFVTADGQVIDRPSGAALTLLGRQGFYVESESGAGVTVAFPETSDIDGDGRAELFIRLHELTVNGAPVTTEQHAVLTARGDTLAHYAPAAALDIIDAEDVDHDQRLDFIVSSPYAWRAPSPCARPEEATVDRLVLTLLAHAQPDGTYSTTDAVAVAFARRVCPTPDGQPSTDTANRRGDDDEFGALRIACARLWGQSPSQALAPFHCQRFRAPGDSACPDPAYRFARLDRGTCPTFFQTWATVPTPLTLR